MEVLEEIEHRFLVEADFIGDRVFSLLIDLTLFLVGLTHS